MPRKDNKHTSDAAGCGGTGGVGPTGSAVRPDGGEKPVRVVADWLRSPATQAVFDTLNRSGAIETRAVGGAVRNTLIGAPVLDIDFATTLTPQEVTDIAGQTGMGVHPTGIAHGTVTIVCQNQTFEVTTLRRDVSTDGRRASVAFTSNWGEDASRRDFTMNALYCNADGMLFDPLGGYQDLMERKVRFIGEPQQRIREDYLRILRFFRFFAAFGSGPIDQAGLAACIELKAGLGSLSGERVQSEIMRLLVAGNAVGAIAVMDESGILQLALGNQVTLDVFSRLCEIEAALGLVPDALLRLCALTSGTTIEARQLAGRLRLSNAQAGRLERMALADCNQDTYTAPIAERQDREQRVALYRLGRQDFEDRVVLEWARAGAPADDRTQRHVLELAQRWQPPEIPFSGADLVARGVKPGPQIGRVLSQFETWWLNEDFPQSRSVLEAKLAELAGAG